MKVAKQLIAGKNNIAWVGNQFTSVFGDMDFEQGTIDGLVTRTLGKWMNNAEIAKEFGPESVTLGDVLAFLETADRTGRHIFYVKDDTGGRWAVDAYWHAGHGGWRLGAYSVSYPDEWSAGNQVVSRTFSDFKSETLSPSDSLPLTLEINGFTYKRV